MCALLSQFQTKPTTKAAPCRGRAKGAMVGPDPQGRYSRALGNSGGAAKDRLKQPQPRVSAAVASSPLELI